MRRTTDYRFPISYWGRDKSTKAQFYPCGSVPAGSIITSCMVCVLYDGRILLTKPARGWGLPGGHIEAGEAPEVCAAREVYEEASVRVANLKMIGAWKVEKLFESECNRQYPELAYQLLFLAELEHVDNFTASHETSERKFVRIDDVRNYHHDFGNFSEILKYIKDIYR